MKSKIYNLIILDESGSMFDVKTQTINGCNETINTIRAAQEEFAETQEHLVSIFAFQDGCRPSRYLIKNVPATAVDHISEKDYEPGGMTPLYDAVGATLVDLKVSVNDEPTSIGNVTIITDGEENSSKEYTREKVAKMIDGLKEIGWSFNFIGANIDVKRAAANLHIDNSLEFQQDDRGTQEMFARERRSRMGWFGRTHAVMGKLTDADCATPEGREQYYSCMRKTSANYFDEDKEKKDE